MDDIERAIGARLVGQANSATPPPELEARIFNGIATRRRRRRGATIVGVAAVTAVLLVVPAVGYFRDTSTSAPDQDPAGPPAPPDGQFGILTAPKAPAELDQLIDRAGAVAVPLRQPDDVLFRADALEETGLIVGGMGFDADPYRASDRRVWLADPRADRPLPLSADGVESAWAYAAGRGVLAWAEDRSDQYQLMCAEPNDETPVARQISDRGVSTWPEPIHVDDEVIVWVDEANGVWAVQGCDGTPWQLPVSPPVVAFAYPDVFVADPAASELHKLDLETETVTRVAGLPEDLLQQDDARFAANDEVVVWSADHRLTLLDRRTGGTREITAGLPDNSRGVGEIIDLTVGNRFVAYSSRGMESDPANNAALVYDLDTATAVALRSEAFAAGDLLLWREDTNYLLAAGRLG